MASVADVDVEECIKASVTSCIIGQAYYGEAKLEWNKDTLTVALKLNSDQIFHATVCSAPHSEAKAEFFTIHLC